MTKLKPIFSLVILLSLNSCAIPIPKNSVISSCEYNPKMAVETNKQVDTLNDLLKQLIIGSDVECFF
jgi:hypothetical protein